jgi:hypothetical protein
MAPDRVGARQRAFDRCRHLNGSFALFNVPLRTINSRMSPIVLLLW